MSKLNNVTSLFRKRNPDKSESEMRSNTGFSIESTPTMMIPIIYIHRFHNGYAFLEKEENAGIEADMRERSLSNWFWSPVQEYLFSEYGTDFEDDVSKLVTERLIDIPLWCFVYDVANRLRFSDQLEVAIALARKERYDLFHRYQSGSNYSFISVWRDEEVPPHKISENLEHLLLISTKARLEKKRERDRLRDVKSPNKRKEEIEIAKRDQSLSFKHWNSLLSSALKSFDNSPLEIEYIRLIGNRCILSLPGAQAECKAYLASRIKSDKESGYPAKYENQYRMEHARIENNKELPKFISILKKAGLLEEAEWTCAQLIDYKIHDGSKGGFQQRLALIQKALNKQL